MIKIVANNSEGSKASLRIIKTIIIHSQSLSSNSHLH